MISHQIANILLHVIFVSAFLAFFFFAYASRVENEVVRKQSKEMVDDIVDDVALLLPDEAITEINTILSTVSPPDMTEEDKKVKETNDALIKKVSIFVSSVLVIGLILVLGISYFYGKSSKEPFTFSSIIIHNVIILAFVALTEFVFLYYFVQNYTSIDSNFVKYTVLKTLDDRIAKQ